MVFFLACHIQSVEHRVNDLFKDTKHTNPSTFTYEQCSNNDDKWKDHISSIFNKAWQRLGMLRSLKFMLSRSSLENMYINFIRPLLEYGDVVWDNCTAELKNDIESIQNEAARIVSGATKLCNIHTLLADLRWDTLACRRRKSSQNIRMHALNTLCFF